LLSETCELSPTSFARKLN